MKTLPGLLLLAPLCLCLLGCPNLEVPDDRIVIGHAACLSGRYAKAGEQAYGGILAAVEWVNTTHGGVRVGDDRLPLEYKRYDCESKREAVTSLLERLISVDRVHAVIAPYSSGLTLAGAPVAEKFGVIYLDHGGASDRIFTQGFTTIVQNLGPASRYHVGTLDMLAAREPEAKRLALAYENSEFAREVKSGTEAYARKLGYEVVFNRTYPRGVSDLTPMLTAMKSARPDIFLGGGHFEDGQLLCRQMADLRIDVKALSVIAAATLPAFHDALTTLADGVMGPSHWEIGVTYSEESAKAAGEEWFGPSQAEFVRLFNTTLGSDTVPDYHAAEAAASVLAFVLGVEKAGTADSETVRRALGELEFTSFYGGWDIDDTGKQVGHRMVDVQWQDGAREIVWPPSARTADFRYPKSKAGE